MNTLTHQEIQEIAGHFSVACPPMRAMEVIHKMNLATWKKRELNWQQLVNDLHRQQKLDLWLGHFCKDFPFAQKSLHKLRNFPVQQSVMQAAQLGQNELLRTSHSTQHNNDSHKVAYLCNRSDQNRDVKKVFKKYSPNAEDYSRPLFFFVHGPVDEKCVEYIEAVKKTWLPRILNSHTQNLQITTREAIFQWPGEDSISPEDLTDDIAEIYPERDKILILRLPITEDTSKKRLKLLKSWIKELNEKQWPQLQHGVLCVFFYFPARPLPRFIVWLKKLLYLGKKMPPHEAYYQCRPIRHLEKKVRYTGVLRVLPSLKSINQEMALAWLELPMTQKRFPREEQRKLLREKIEKDWFCKKNQRITIKDFAEKVEAVITTGKDKSDSKPVLLLLTALLLVFVVVGATWMFFPHRASAQPTDSVTYRGEYGALIKTKILDPQKLNAQQWREVFRNHGFKHIRRVVKHRKMGKEWFIVCEFNDGSKQAFRAVQRREDFFEIYRSIPGKFRALLIAINDYSSWTPLKTPHNDAKELRKVLCEKYCFDAEDVELIHEEVTDDKIVTALDELAKNSNKNDSVLIFYAGHGAYDKNNDRSYWVQQEAKAKAPYGTYISDSDIRDSIANVARKCKHVLVMSDCCYSGKLVDSERSGGKGIAREKGMAAIDQYVVYHSQQKSCQILTSGGVEKVGDDYDKSGHSPFAYFLLQRLRKNERLHYDTSQMFLDLKKDVGRNVTQKPRFGRLKYTGYDNKNEGEFFFQLKHIQQGDKK
ncbi:caspase family protein [Candidatus Uabimicrobium amorphum]|uniref:Polysaccharide deacetylase n=1 Tax=Uabimicrobium amorphum TaxID=2596890 RepID=A0A5S9ISB5_UABAM|nr:caspase family protein [Candidatus Uabimicrobium amorphum]BBM86250.1 polysaccharide deacetylase [Candidatus Uabimicrobium amorphum]